MAEFLRNHPNVRRGAVVGLLAGLAIFGGVHDQTANHDRKIPGATVPGYADTTAYLRTVIGGVVAGGERNGVQVVVLQEDQDKNGLIVGVGAGPTTDRPGGTPEAYLRCDGDAIATYPTVTALPSLGGAEQKIVDKLSGAACDTVTPQLPRAVLAA